MTDTPDSIASDESDTSKNDSRKKAMHEKQDKLLGKKVCRKKAPKKTNPKDRQVLFLRLQTQLCKKVHYQMFNIPTSLWD
jgi:hypothetical protein